MKKFLIIIFIILLLMGCSSNENINENAIVQTFQNMHIVEKVRPEDTNSIIYKVVDDSNSIVCYAILGGTGVGIDCLDIKTQ